MILSALIARVRTVHSRVYENVTPKHTTLPAITISIEGSFRNRHYGSSNIQTGLIDTDFEISIWGTTADSTHSIAESILSDIENVSGPWIDGGGSSHRIAGIEITSEITNFDARTELNNYSIFITITHTSG